MTKCNRCKIQILDDSLLCPLCRGVLERSTVGAYGEVDSYHKDEMAGNASSDENQLDGEEALGDKKDIASMDMDDIGMDEIEMYESKSVMYPDVKPANKKIRMVIKCFVFISILVECILVLINYLTYKGVKWSLICGAALVYLCFTVAYCVPKNTGHRSKIFGQMVGSIILAILIDCFLGYTGWSLNYVTPIAIMLFDITILVFMIVNSNNWQNYIILQVAMLLVSLGFGILALTGVVTWPLLTVIAIGVSAIILIATVVFGDKTAITELSRRFRV
ncbi:MAG: hypothetical protein J6A59_12010 [Lachnospiraceae bacterium]|nr:hypothetical protein [Lachnospiraceae bacterium]